MDVFGKTSQMARKHAYNRFEHLGVIPYPRPFGALLDPSTREFGDSTNSMSTRPALSILQPFSLGRSKVAKNDFPVGSFHPTPPPKGGGGGVRKDLERLADKESRHDARPRASQASAKVLYFSQRKKLLNFFLAQ